MPSVGPVSYCLFFLVILFYSEPVLKIQPDRLGWPRQLAATLNGQGGFKIINSMPLFTITFGLEILISRLGILVNL
jgi:hypothetical protein